MLVIQTYIRFEGFYETKAKLAKIRLGWGNPMLTIELAGHAIGLHCRYEYLPRLCTEYRTDASPEWEITADEDDLARENPQGKPYAAGYLESLALYRKICERLIREDVLLFHGSALALDGKGYLFTAPSGTGKSTHAALWRRVFGERVRMINDDKPLLRVAQKEVTVYGTPWAGKANLQTNTSVPVAGIVLLYQASENTIRPMTGREAYPRLLSQTHRVQNPQGLVRTLDLVQRLAKLPIYELGCTPTPEAALLAYRTLTQKEDIQ